MTSSCSCTRRYFSNQRSISQWISSLKLNVKQILTPSFIRRVNLTTIWRTSIGHQTTPTFSKSTKNVYDFILTKRLSYVNYSTTEQNATFYWRAIRNILFDLCQSLDTSYCGTLGRLRPLLFYFITRHLQVMLSCSICSDNSSKKFLGAISLLKNAMNPIDLQQYEFKTKHWSVYK